MKKSKLLLLGLIAAIIGSYFIFDLGQYLTLEYAQYQFADIQNFKNENFALTAFLYFSIYVLVTALSIPGALIMTLVGGWYIWSSLGNFLGFFCQFNRRNFCVSGVSLAITRLGAT